jgi:hypothetical protein
MLFLLAKAHARSLPASDAPCSVSVQ